METSPLREPDPVYGNIGAIKHETDPGPRTLKCVMALPGTGQWAYYTSVERPLLVMPDRIFNPHSPNFAGAFEKVWSSDEAQEVWIITEGFVTPQRERMMYVEDEDEGLPRMEHRD